MNDIVGALMWSAKGAFVKCQVDNLISMRFTSFVISFKLRVWREHSKRVEKEMVSISCRKKFNQRKMTVVVRKVLKLLILIFSRKIFFSRFL